MGLLRKILGLGPRGQDVHRVDPPHHSPRHHRLLRFEEMESRKLMAADLHVGSVYYEQAGGDDAQANILQFTFEGGAAGTQLTRIVIDGDKDGQGLSSGDVFFDTAPGGLGVFKSNPVKILSHDGFEVLGVQVVDGGTRMVIDLAGFDAGEKLILSVDVDEAQYVDSANNDIDVNAVAEGAEFQRSHFICTFQAPHYEDLTTSVQYWDEYDARFATVENSTGLHLNLPPDRYDGPVDLTDFTAGAVAQAEQIPLPSSLSGVVFYDKNLNNRQDSGEQGIGGVHLTLYLLNGNQYLSTGLTTVTDTLGNYKFDDLDPGQYRIVETQPLGYFSVGAQAGKVGGVVRGTVTSPDVISGVTLLGGEDSVRNDFAEALPNSISGYVNVDGNQNCITDPGEAPIAGVVIHLLNEQGQVIATTTTNEMGYYEFSNLAPGVYGVFEEQPAGYYNGCLSVGTTGGEESATDTITEIVLGSDDHGVHYDFRELEPVSISGRVHINTTGDCLNPANPPLPGVTIELLNEHGQVIDTTITDADGYYEFVALPPGTYSVHEIQPEGYYSAATFVGSAGGIKGDDWVTEIVLTSGTDAVHYDFCELLPVSISGRVHLNTTGDCLNPANPPIPGVIIQLLNENGQVIDTTITDADGYYEFVALPPGTYSIHEIQPEGYYSAATFVGSAGGTKGNDVVTNIVLTSGVRAVDYDFCELLPVSISGRVHVNTTGDCADPTNPPLSGVLIQLLDANGIVIDTRHTDADGNYRFDDLRPGTYTVREIQPEEYFNGATFVGTAGGDKGNDIISNIVLTSGMNGLHYDFCEIPPGAISGFVFQDGPPITVTNPGDPVDVPAVRDGVLTPDDTRLPGVTLMLRDGVTGVPILGAAALPGTYAANQPIMVVTDSNGYYEFVGLRPGMYAVYEVAPDGYIRAIDTAGSLGGIVISMWTVVDPSVLDQLVDPPTDDAIIQINLAVAQNSINNNFSLVVTTSGVQVFVFPQPPGGQAAALPLPFFPAEPPLIAPLVPPVPFLYKPQLTGAGGGLYTWHLSIIDAGQPRGTNLPVAQTQLTSTQLADEVRWHDSDMEEGEWTLLTNVNKPGEVARKLKFGVRRGTPVVGDFNGDGTYEAGIFIDGEWFIDLNDNGTWDSGDLWAKLGHRGDLPVTGDWDGDGKTDIGIYGPAWPRDPRAIASEPGLPDPYNENVNVPKNIPRPPHRTAVGKREMKLTAKGHPREDLIDHVFLYGLPGDHPIVGDWNGDGIDTIAVFRDGRWHRDVDGDGKWTNSDVKQSFGQTGDVPIVGDFNGDGVDELGIFRDGTWYIDTNGNGTIDGEDQVFQLGQAGDKPVVGDWDGDGTADPGVYHPKAAAARTAHK